MTYQKSLMFGALTGAALAIVFVAWPVNAKPMDPPPPQWLECVKHGEGECASGGDDTINSTGNSIIRAACEFRRRGAVVERAAVIVERDLGARHELRRAGIRFHALFHERDFAEAGQ